MNVACRNGCASDLIRDENIIYTTIGGESVNIEVAYSSDDWKKWYNSLSLQHKYNIDVVDDINGIMK